MRLTFVVVSEISHPLLDCHDILVEICMPSSGWIDTIFLWLFIQHHHLNKIRINTNDIPIISTLYIVLISNHTYHELLYFWKCNLLISLSQFSPDQPVCSETLGYVKSPCLKDKIHCVTFVVDASKILTYPKGLSTTMQQLREHISDLGEHRTNNTSDAFFYCVYFLLWHHRTQPKSSVNYTSVSIWV